MMTRDPAIAADLLQDTFVRFLRADVGGLDDAQLKAYLYKTAGSVLHDHYRAQTRDRRRRTEIPRPATRPEIDPGLSQDVNRIFRELDPKQQTLLWLAYVEGLDHREIARVLRMKERSIRVVLHRARRKLAGLFTRAGLGPGDLR